jgi:hypothetical protein
MKASTFTRPASGRENTPGQLKFKEMLTSSWRQRRQAPRLSYDVLSEIMRNIPAFIFIIFISTSCTRVHTSDSLIKEEAGTERMNFRQQSGKPTAVTTPIIDRLQPIPLDSAFRQDGHFVWGGSLIKVDKEYHLFASRWPEPTGFPGGYRDHSEIVRATANRAEGPYEFQEVVLAGRGEPYWDGKMCHNPKIVKAGDMYVLYYIGSACGSGLRKVGYAWSSSVTGPWTRLDEPVCLGDDANNPAPLVHSDGSVLLAYRDRELHMHIARAPSFDGPYEVIARDIFPEGRLEDPDLFFQNGKYHMVMEDNKGVLTGGVRFGGHLVSDDGITWQPHYPRTVYTHDIEYDDGTRMKADRRERPQMFHDPADNTRSAGEPTHLVTAVLNGKQAWCIIQPIRPDNESNNPDAGNAQLRP